MGGSDSTPLPLDLELSCFFSTMLLLVAKELLPPVLVEPLALLIRKLCRRGLLNTNRVQGDCPK